MASKIQVKEITLGKLRKMCGKEKSVTVYDGGISMRGFMGQSEEGVYLYVPSARMEEVSEGTQFSFSGKEKVRYKVKS